MASEKEILSFIKEIAPHAQKAYKTLGKVLPSVCIGMACVESAYGTSKIMRKYNAFFGYKVGTGKTATKYWDGTSFNSKTSEEYTVGTHTAIKANFRSYKSMEQCVMNFYELLNTSLYSRVQDNVGYETQMAQIKQCGYMTSSTEVNSVISLIKRYNLTQYDSPVVEEKAVEDSPYKVGKVYTLQVNLFVRHDPNGKKKKLFELTTNARMFAQADVSSNNAVLMKGTKVTCKATAKLNGATWMQIPSGWICAITASGKKYVL